MSVRGRLLEMLTLVAEALGPDLRTRLVFVGGCTTALFITDPVTLEDVRATDDVDLIIDLAGYPAWADLQARLRTKGFVEASEDPVICRMTPSGLKVDVMPDDANILAFTNRWYARGIATATDCPLAKETIIKILKPELFLATKFEAYLGRGGGDLLGSCDLEDVLLVVDGREEVVDEVRRADADIRRFIAEQFRALLENQDVDYFLEGNIRGPAGRVDLVRARIMALCDDGD